MKRRFRNILVVLLVCIAATSVFAQSNVTIQARANVHLEMGTTVTVGSLTVAGSATGPGIWKLSLTSVEQQFEESKGTTMSTMPDRYELNQNYPNPFNPTTTISFSIPHQSYITLTVFDALGREVATLQNGEVDAGVHSVPFNATGFSSGVYIYRLRAHNNSSISQGVYTSVKKLLLIR